MSTLAAILTQFPNCRVTIASNRPTRRKPRAGDRRLTKRWGWQIRRQQVARHGNGQIIDYCVRRGRPVYEWVQENSLTADELDLLRRVGANHGGLNPYTPSPS